MSFGFVLFLLCSVSFVQMYAVLTPDELLDKVRAKIRTVKDFQADAEIKIDVEFLKAPVSHATIYYRSPGQVRVKSDGFAMLPKQGAGLPVATILESEFSVIPLKDELYNGTVMRVLKVIPLSDTGQIIASTMWIDEANQLVQKIKIITKTGIMLLEMNYTSAYKTYALPSSVIISFDMPKFSLPKTITGDILNDAKPKDKGNKNTVGKVIITYSKYIINKGLADSYFN